MLCMVLTYLAIKLSIWKSHLCWVNSVIFYMFNATLDVVSLPLTFFDSLMCIVEPSVLTLELSNLLNKVFFSCGPNICVFPIQLVTI